MRNLIISIIMWISISIPSFAQFGFNTYSTCAYYDGFWSKWDDRYTNIFDLYGNYHSIAIYEANTHPSNFYFKFEIDNFQIPDKKTIKNHYKNKTWYEYSGWVEYNITDQYPTAKDALRNNPILFPNFPYVLPQQRGDTKPTVTKRVRATIKIEPFKKTPKVYNIFYENVGFAINLENNTFRNW